jgi:glycosyltransferase involved in cell wall biosynthesis
MKILIVTDAWKPQMNGVVRTYEYLERELVRLGHRVLIVGPRDFPIRLPMPGYAEIELALFTRQKMARMIDAFAPDTIHIGTEGPLGSTARRICLKRRLPFTSCYHTQFPDYAAKRAAQVAPFLADPVKRFFINRLRHFHRPSSALMVATASLERQLEEWGFTTPLRRLTRGAETALFTAERKALFAHYKQPVAIYVGRVAIEKNLEAYLAMDWPGTKVVVGDGPDLAMLQSHFPEALFTGRKTGEDLAAHYQSADIFVFPSKTDTFGMVLVEALSCGLPIAAYPVIGPADIVTEPMLGALDEDLSKAARTGLAAPGTREQRHMHVEAHHTWPAVAQQFMEIVKSSGALIPPASKTRAAR